MRARLAAMWASLGQQKYPELEQEIARPCWLVHGEVDSEDLHVLMQCDEAARLLKARRLREVLGEQERETREAPVALPVPHVVKQERGAIRVDI